MEPLTCAESLGLNHSSQWVPIWERGRIPTSNSQVSYTYFIVQVCWLKLVLLISLLRVKFSYSVRDERSNICKKIFPHRSGKMESSTGAPCGPHSAQLVAHRVPRWLYLVLYLALWMVVCVYWGGEQGAVNYSTERTILLFKVNAKRDFRKYI